MGIETADKTLAQRMRNRADADNLPADHPLRVQSVAFDKAYREYMFVPTTMPVAQFIGVWAKTRKVWCDYSGEPLL